MRQCEDPRFDHVAAHIVEVLGELIGKKVVNVTQHAKGQPGFIQLEFEDGLYLKIDMEDGRGSLHHNCEPMPPRQ